MSNYIIITDSSCDLPANLADELGLVVLPLSVSVDGTEYANFLDGREIGFPEYYAKIRKGSEAKTSAVNTDSFIREMTKALDAGLDVLYLGFSSGLSATYGAGETAAAELRAKYPERRIYTIDTLCASGGQGLLVYLAAREKQKGKSIDEVCDFADSLKPNVCHWFTVDDLNHLRRGGRLSGAATVIGSLLRIKPVLHVDDEGKLVKMSQVKGRKASLMALYDCMVASADKSKEQTLLINHGDCAEDAELLADAIKKSFRVKEVIIHYIGPVIGAHTGAGVVALFFLGDKR